MTGNKPSTELSADCRRLQSAGAASMALGTSASSHSWTSSATILSATFCRHSHKQVVSKGTGRHKPRRFAVIREADLLAGGEEVEEVQRGGGDAEAEALVRAFLGYLVQSSEALPAGTEKPDGVSK